jgi:hypothetical protein
MAAGKERALRRRSYLRNIPHLPSFMILKQKALELLIVRETSLLTLRDFRQRSLAQKIGHCDNEE